MKKRTLFLLMASLIVAQNIPINMDAPVYDFLERHESRGHINSENWSTRPYTHSQITSMLVEIESHKAELSNQELQILKWYQQSFNRNFSKETLTFPWSRSNWSRILRTETSDARPLFMTYHQGNASAWISWSETFRIQNNAKASRGYHTDHLEISGSKGPIAFSTQYTFFRVTRHEKFSELPDSYKEGYLLDRDYMKWINWGYPTSSLTYTHPDFTLGIHRQPVYWGYSATNSPILSDNINPLPYVEWTTQMPHLRFKFMHARLSPNEKVKQDTTNERRNLSAHRVEFDLTPNFEFAFNEFVVYAYRDFELGYLNPVNFLFAEEQVQGDLDNKLMALDFKWKIIPGLTSYGTWFFDELDFWKLFSGWWGNKFVFQLGATYYPKRNLPSLSLEYTAARPWTYTHKNPINSFTSGGRALGLPLGPNSSILSISSTWSYSSKLNIWALYEWETNYDGVGSDILQAYSYTELEENPSEGFWNGDKNQSTYFQVLAQYRMTQSLSFGIDVAQREKLTTTLSAKFRY
ncbi:MAG: hypothetical protein HON50_13410 [Candidatus Marinimicrobia bacterium]|nr:hypothetical protein [Candidatus Neomarinimicrobiota bacterium]